MKTPSSENTVRMLEDAWCLTPGRLAERLTDRAFKRFAYVRYLEKVIAQSVARGGGRILVTMPPRHGKSWLASLFTPIWFLSLWQDKRVVLAASDAATAESHSKRIRELIKENQSLLKLQLHGSSGSAGNWKTARGGGLSAIGVGQAIDVSGGDLMIIDDPIKSAAQAQSPTERQKQIDWFESAFVTKAEPGATIVVMMSRWHEDDLAGYIKRNHGNAWTVVDLPALAEDEDVLGRVIDEPLCVERFDHEALDRLRLAAGSRFWTAMYQQSPLGARRSGERFIDQNMWKQYQALPDRFDEVVQSWDLSFKSGDRSDFVVGQVWGRVGGEKFLIDQIRKKMDFVETLAAVESMTKKYPDTVKTIVEDKANGSALVSVLREKLPGLVMCSPRVGKLARVERVMPDIEQGRVYLPSEEAAPWIREFVDECSGFPRAKHDDQVDAMVYALGAFRVA